jgi:hypothetical protein
MNKTGFPTEIDLNSKTYESISELVMNGTDIKAVEIVTRVLIILNLL